MGILVTSLFLCGYVVASVVWGPASELGMWFFQLSAYTIPLAHRRLFQLLPVGRKPTLVISLGCYTILHLGQALAQNIETLLITRFLGGFFACAPLSNCAGVIVDMWDPMRRGIATSIWAAAVFLGPVLGPIAGGL